MGIEYYGFALFIFCLACLFALLCKYLFGRTKNRLQNLDEKEKKLLTFYSTLEDMMDEFNDSAVQANADLARQITEIRTVAASMRNPTAQQPAPTPEPTPPLRQPLTTQPSIISAPPPPQTQAQPVSAPASFAPPEFEAIKEAAANEAKAGKGEADRSARILDLHKNGMDRMRIAKELSVTVSEVNLVLGIAGQKK